MGNRSKTVGDILQLTITAAYFIIILLSANVSAYFFSECFGFRINKTAAAVCTAIPIPLLISEYLFGPANTVWFYTAFFVLLTLAFLLASEKRSFKTVLFSLLMTLTDAAAFSVGTYTHRAFTDSFAEKYSLIYTVITASSFMLTIPVKAFISKLWNRSVNMTETKRMFIYPVFTAIQLTAGAFYLLREMNDESELNIKIFVNAFLILSIADGILFIAERFIQNRERLESELERIKDVRKMEARHYNEIEEKRYELAKIRHDIKNQLTAVKVMIENKNDTVADYIVNELSEKLENTKESRFCSIPLIEALMSEKSNVCDKNGIAFSCSIDLGDVPEEKHLNDILRILSNMTDNAIHECMLCEENNRSIRVESVRNAASLVIRTTNTTNKPDGHLIPQNSSGYGLRILADIAERYNGVFGIKIFGRICTAEIMLSLE